MGRPLEALLWCAAAFLAAAGLALVAPALARGPVQRDFDAYYSAARMANAHLPIYAPPPDSIMGPESPSPPHREYVYPPLLAGLLRPLAALPYRMASLLWLAVNVLLAGAVVLVLCRLSVVAQRYPWWTLCVVLALPATYTTWFEGQVGMFVGALILLCAAEAVRPAADRGTRPDFVAGAALGFAAALKVYPVVLIPVFAWHRRWRVVGAAIMVGVLASACGALLTGGIDDTIYWVTHVLRAVAERPWPANQSLAAVIERLAPGPALSIWTGGEYVTVHLRALLPSAAAARLLTRIGQFSILAVTGWVVWRRGAVGTAEALRRDLALGVLLMSLLVPVVWDHYYLQLLLPAAVLADVAGRDTTSRQALIVAALGIILQRFWRQLLLHFGSTGLVLLGGFAAVVVLWAALLYDDARRWRRMPFASTGPTTAVSA